MTLHYRLSDGSNQLFENKFQGRIYILFRVTTYEGVPKIFWTDIKIINLTTKCVWKLPTSTRLRATWHTDSLDLVRLQSIGVSRYYNCCIDGSTSPEYFGYTLVSITRNKMLFPTYWPQKGGHVRKKVLRYSLLAFRKIHLPLITCFFMPKGQLWNF
jgi:hypothetical protein